MDDSLTDHFETSRLTRERFEELRASDKLPTPSNVALQVMEQVQQDNTCIADIAEVLRGDPALSGRLLDLANSALYYPKNPVVTIQDAVTTVGLRNIQQLVLGISIISQHRTGGCELFDYKLFWSQSLAMAVAAEVCCEKRFRLAPAEAFTVGLIARIGQLALATVYADKYEEILEAPESFDPLKILELEQADLTIDHIELSCAMMEEWGLPVSLIRPLRAIYSCTDTGLEPDSRDALLGQLYNYAFKVSGYCVAGSAQRSEKEELLREICADFGFCEDSLQGQLETTESKWREVSSILQLPCAEAPKDGKRVRQASADVTTIPQAAGRGAQGSGLRILIAGNVEREQQFLEQTLVQAGHYVIPASDGRDALRKVLENAPEIMIIDMDLGEIDGVRLTTLLRDNKYGKSLYVLLCDSSHSEPAALRALEAGADGYLSWPLNKESLLCRVDAAGRVVARMAELTDEILTLNSLAAELAQSNRKMEEQSLCDALTGLPNRRYANNRLKQCMMESARTEHPLSIMMLDLDRFKQVNDVHGHAMGDEVLKRVSEAYQKVCRGSDEVCRMGGEEFLVICRNTRGVDAMIAANRLREAVAELEFGQNKPFRVTVSIGISMLEEGETDIDNLLHQSDLALYEAKHSGRNYAKLFSELKPGDDRVVNI